MVKSDLKAYLDGELSTPRRMLVTFHLTRCTDCKEEIAWLQRLGRSMSSLEGAQPSPQLRTRILATLPPMEMDVPARQPQRDSLANRRPVRGLVFAAAACCALALMVSPVLISRHQSLYTANGQNSAVVKGIGKLPGQKPTEVGNSGSPAEVAPSPVTDPTSAAADRLVAEEAHQEKIRIAKQMPGLWSKAVNAAKAADQAGGHNFSPPVVMVALNVGDTHKAEVNLRKWAESAGAVVQYAGGELVLRFNPEKASSLLTSLRQQGELASVGTSGVTNIGAPAGPGEHRPMPAVPGDDHTAAPAALNAPGGSARLSGAVPHTDTSASHTAKMITVVVMLGHI